MRNLMISSTLKASECTEVMLLLFKIFVLKFVFKKRVDLYTCILNIIPFLDTL